MRVVLLLLLSIYFVHCSVPVFQEPGIHSWRPVSNNYWGNTVNVCGNTAGWYGSSACQTYYGTAYSDPSIPYTEPFNDGYYACTDLLYSSIYGKCPDDGDFDGLGLSNTPYNEAYEAANGFPYCLYQKTRSYAPLSITGINTDRNSNTQLNGITIEIDMAWGQNCGYYGSYNGGCAPPSINIKLGDPSAGPLPDLGTFTPSQPCSSSSCATYSPPIWNEVSCNTFTQTFPNTNLGVNYQLLLTIYNANYNGGASLYYDARLNFANDVAISSVRLIENFICSYKLSAKSALSVVSDNTVRADIYQSRGDYFLYYQGQQGGIWEPNYVQTCDLCHGLNGGSSVCTAQNNPQTALLTSFNFNINPPTTGLAVRRAVFIAYGAVLSPNVKLSLVVNGKTWFGYSSPDRSTPPDVNGNYYFCGNCMYNTFIIDSVEGAVIGSNSAELYSSGSDTFCMSGWQFLFFVSDVDPPTVSCKQNLGAITVFTQAVTLPYTGPDYIASKTDNCDIYNIPNNLYTITLDTTSVDIWDYPSTLQTVTTYDRAGNVATCTSPLTITPQKFPIIQPTYGTSYFTSSIIVQWYNYAPIMDARTLTQIYIVQDSVTNSGCVDTTPIYLARDYPYYKFELFYSDTVNQIDTTCPYVLHVQFVRYGDQQLIEFTVSNVGFQYKGAPPNPPQ